MPPFPDPNVQTQRFEELDVLRGIAALAVVVFHYSGHCSRYFTDFPFEFAYGKYGVQLFFVISGFVIFFTLERSKSLQDFAFSRFSRLYPAYWATLALLLSISLFQSRASVWWGGFAINATMLQKFVGYPDIDMVYWSLAVELTFYLIIATIFALRGWTKITQIALLWLVLASLSNLVASGSLHPIFHQLGSLLILPHAPYFITGIMFCLWKEHGPSATYALIIILAWGCVWSKGDGEEAAVAGIIFSLFAGAQAGRLRFTISRWTLWLGSISYPLYLIHRNIGYELIFELNKLGVPSLLSFTTAIFVALALATALSSLVERPAMRGLRRWYRRRFAAAATP